MTVAQHSSTAIHEKDLENIVSVLETVHLKLSLAHMPIRAQLFPNIIVTIRQNTDKDLGS